MCRAARVFLLLLLAAPAGAATLENGQVRADFDARGLVAIATHAPAVTIPISRDGFAITVDGTRYDAATLPAPSQQISGDAVSYLYTSGRIRLRVRYTLPAGAAFVLGLRWVVRRMAVARGPIPTGTCSPERSILRYTSAASTRTPLRLHPRAAT